MLVVVNAALRLYPQAEMRSLVSSMVGYGPNYAKEYQLTSNSIYAQFWYLRAHLRKRTQSKRKRERERVYGQHNSSSLLK